MLDFKFLVQTLDMLNLLYLAYISFRYFKIMNYFSGSIIRAMRRLEELLRQMIQASKAIGIDLETKFADGVKLIKRDIVFAASLYL